MSDTMGTESPCSNLERRSISKLGVVVIDVLARVRKNPRCHGRRGRLGWILASGFPEDVKGGVGVPVYRVRAFSIESQLGETAVFSFKKRKALAAFLVFTDSF